MTNKSSGNTDFRPYPLTTIEMNRYGHLEMKQGEVSKYIQLESDIEAIFESLPEEDQVDIDNGWIVDTYFISDEYFK